MHKNLFVGCNGKVAAIDPSSGAEIWRTVLSTGFISATSLQDVTVLDYDGKVFAGCHGHLFCLDAGSGAVLWHSKLEGLGYNDVALCIDGRSSHGINKTKHHH